MSSLGAFWLYSEFICALRFTASLNFVGEQRIFHQLKCQKNGLMRCFVLLSSYSPSYLIVRTWKCFPVVLSCRHCHAICRNISVRERTSFLLILIMSIYNDFINCELNNEWQLDRARVERNFVNFIHLHAFTLTANINNVACHCSTTFHSVLSLSHPALSDWAKLIRSSVHPVCTMAWQAGSNELKTHYDVHKKT